MNEVKINCPDIFKNELCIPDFYINLIKNRVNNLFYKYQKHNI